MNIDEKIAFDYLSKLGKEIPIFEPYGNRPPDFSINNLGIEVRRLNQNIFIGGKALGPEKMDFIFPKVMEKILKGFDSNYFGQSFWLTIKYRRSKIEKIHLLKRELKVVLQRFLIVRPKLPCTKEIIFDVEINFYESQPFRGKVFHIFSLSDYDSGGWVLSTYLQNIKYSIETKVKKIDPFKNDFNNWWLLLIDRIGFGFHHDELEELKSLLGEISFFKKVIVLNPITLIPVFEFGL